MGIYITSKQGLPYYFVFAHICIQVISWKNTMSKNIMLKYKYFAVSRD